MNDDIFSLVRDDFPYLNEVVYLNTAAVGLSFERQSQAAGEYYREFKRRGYNADAEADVFALGVRRKIARVLGVDAQDVFFFSSTTESVNYIAHSLNFAEGQKVLVPSGEYPAVELPWSALATKGGQVKTVEVTSEERRERELIQRLDNKTAVCAISQVNFSTGTMVDAEAIAKVCRESDTLLLIDGTQAMGACAPAAGAADIYLASSYKWLLGTFGLCIAVIKKRARDRLTPAFIGMRGHAFEYSHLNYPSLWPLDAALSYFDELGWESVYERVHKLSGFLMDELETIGIEPATPRDKRAGIVSFAVPDAAGIVEKLEQRGIYAAARGGFVRASAHFYNSIDDISRFTEAIKLLR